MVNLKSLSRIGKEKMYETGLYFQYLDSPTGSIEFGAGQVFNFRFVTDHYELKHIAGAITVPARGVVIETLAPIEFITRSKVKIGNATYIVSRVYNEKTNLSAFGTTVKRYISLG